MRKLLIGILIVVPLFSFTQQLDSIPLVEIPLKEGKIFYEQIEELDSTLTKDKIYLAIKQWFARAFKDAKSVIQIDDKEGGKILGQGNYVQTVFYKSLTITTSFSFTINVDFKDKKYRVQLYDFEKNENFNYKNSVSMPSPYSSVDIPYKAYLDRNTKPQVTQNTKNQKKKKEEQEGRMADKEYWEKFDNENKLIIASLKKSVLEFSTSSNF